MAEFKLGRIRFVWQGDWITGQTYYKDDIIRYGGKTYLCVIGHIANADFYADTDNIPTRWNQVTDGQEWKSDWTIETIYKENDIVKYGGYLYICNNGHTSAATLLAGLELNQSDWDIYAESFDYKTNWEISTRYKVNDIVKYGGNSYLCNEGHVSAATLSSGLEVDLAKWDIYAESFNWIGDWSITTRYKINDIVTYGGTTYICNSGHTSSGTVSAGLEADQGKWDYMNRGTDYKGNWSNATIRYKINDIVKYGAGVWICTAFHSSSVSTTFESDEDSGRWIQYVEGLEFESTWTAGNIYQPGDIVTYGGYSYQALTNHTALIGTPPSTNATDWILYTTGLRFQNDWVDSASYRVGDVIRLNGYTYVAVVDNLNQIPPNLTYWERLNSGVRWQAAWAGSNDYVLGDAVRYDNSSYICILAHSSVDVGTRPDNDVTGTYWNLLSGGPEESVLTTIGDTVYYGGAGPTRLPIGTAGQVYTVSNSGVPEWSYYGVIPKIVYVAPHGENTPAPLFGLTIDRPWSSVRYAAEQIEKGIENSNAGHLLATNRTFIQAEVTEWVNQQITLNTGIWAGFINNNPALRERDTGLIVDAIVYDLTHLGNAKTVAATQSYFTAFGVLIDSIQDEYLQDSAAFGYISTLVTAILANTAPAVNYQTLNGVVSPVKQIIDTDYTAESNALTTCNNLLPVITTALTTQSLNSLPQLDVTNYTINVKTGQYYEVLPIRVPANTSVVGDELRSTRVSPAGKLVANNDKAKSLTALSYIRTITGDVIQNITVTPTTGNTVTQDTTSQRAGDIGSSTALASVIANAAEIKDIITNNTPDAYVLPTPTGGSGNAFTAGYFNAARLIDANKAFLQDEVSAWINAQIVGEISPFVDFVYGGTQQTTCERDVGYIVDALVYDLTYGGNLATEIAARSYYSLGSFVEPTIEKAPALAVQLRIKDIIDNIATGDIAGWTKTTGLTQDVSGTAGSGPAATTAQTRIQEIYDTIDTGISPTTISPDFTWSDEELITARAAITSARTEIQSDAVQFVKRSFPTLNFDEALCSRDVGYIVDALGYDLMFGSNFLSIQSGLSYRRGLASTEVVLTTQLEAQQAVVDFIGLKVSEIAASGAVVFADLLWSYIIGIVTSETFPVNTGRNTPTTSIDMINGATILRLNAGFLAAEATAYINETFKTAVSASTSATNTFTCSSQSWLVAGDTIRFTGVFGGVAEGTTYYVLASGLTATTFKVSLTLDGTAVDLSDDTGSMSATWFYAADRCENDVISYIAAIAEDMTYTGNYYVVFASRYYKNALRGSKLEDMYYVRNGGGVRNQTLTDLDGTSDGNTAGAGSATGLTVANEFGTSRPLAGAYVSLDPGWGPNDTRVWITNKSTYVQNVTTFGTACTGQKIDGSLHAGGNDSIVSNDFTQILSDGIGAWITNLGRAELVSVFAYYNHIAYLAENGGKIRATNGNNSYGTFGSVAEGVDVTEDPVIGTVNNRNTEAIIGNVFTDGDQILSIEYNNAGVEYTSATYTISGAGNGVEIEGDEFRFAGVYEGRLTDPGDSSGPGGVGYLTASNLAQTGNTTQITLANTEIASSVAYVGMSIYITTGTGAGQYGVIATYNAPTKIATINKESTGTSGWDHIVPGTNIEAELNVTSAYTISPRLNIAAPTYTTTKIAELPSAAEWSVGAYGNSVGTYSAVTSTSSGSGTLATFNVTRKNGLYTVTLSAAGINYAEDDVLTIAGTSLDGTSPANDITITVSSINLENSDSVVSFSHTGNAISPQFVALSTSSSTIAASSVDGTTWESRIIASGSWSSVAYGVINGNGIYVAISSTAGTAASSVDGINWITQGMPTTSAWASVTFGNGRFIAVSNSSNDAAYSLNGTSWTSTGALPGSNEEWTSVVYGKGIFVAVSSNGTQAASSINGTTWASRTMPATEVWTSVAYGKNRFVAVSSASDATAYSLNGTTWTASTLPSSLEWNTVSYGNGVFYAVATGSVAATSEDGIIWTAKDTTFDTATITSTSKDIIGTFTTSTLPSSGYWTDIIWTGTKFVTVGHDNNAIGYAASSVDGTTWTDVTIPSTGGYEYSAVAYNGSNKYVAFINFSRNIATSTDGVTWVDQSTNGVDNLPAARSWYDAEFGEGVFVVVGGGGANPTAYSVDGTNWITGTIGTQTWSSVAYGSPEATPYFVAVSSSQNAAYSTDGITWTTGTTLPSSDVWSSVAFGDNTFVAVAGDSATATTSAAYSTNGTTWTAATMPGAAAKWISVSYGGGLFMAFEYGGTRTAISIDGITWSEGPAISSSNWNNSAYGNNKFAAVSTGGSTVSSYINYVLDTNYLTTTNTELLSVGDLIVFDATTFGSMIADTVYYIKTVNSATTFTISETSGGSTFVLSTGSGAMTSTISKNYVAAVYGIGKWIVLSPNNTRLLTTTFGAKARARSYVSENKITQIWLQEPGGGYLTTPSITITDPNNTGADATVTIRIGDGVLASPSFINRGTLYSSASAQVDGDGFADTYQIGTFLFLNNLTARPSEGANLQIAGIDDVYYRVVQVTQFIGPVSGEYSARLQISPALNEAESPEHAESISLRKQYSQVRLTGHDFLLIGTGNKTLSNYPGIPLQDPNPAKETVNANGGRVFYTSTDQDGNFRVGGLFSVEQATGVATLNADAFNLAGLNELQLGSVALGGAGANISEFSTDPFFTADSDNVIPTQRAIKAYISSQIGGGGSSLNVNSLTAGVIYIAGNSITTTTEVQININTKVNFLGGVDGSPVALNYFLLG